MSKGYQHKVTVVLDGAPLGTWDTFSGGAVSRNNSKYRAGGLTTKRVIPGLPDFDDVTVGRVLEVDRDAEILASLLSASKPMPMTVTRTPLDVDGNTFGGDAIVYQGFLESVNPGDANSDDDGLVMAELTMTVATVVTV